MNEVQKKITNALDHTANYLTRWIGSVASIIVHTIIFVISFILYFFGVNIDKILLVVTTIVSLEAIYLAIFIQMSVNKQEERLGEVATDIDEIQEDIDEIQEDVDEIQEDIEEDVIEEGQEDVMLGRIENTLEKLIAEIAELKKQHNENQISKK